MIRSLSVNSGPTGFPPILAFMAQDTLTWRVVGERLALKGRGAKNQLAKKLGIDASDLSRRFKRSGEPTASQVRLIEDFLEDRSGSGVAEEGAPFSHAPAGGTRRLPVFGYAGLSGPDRVALASDQILEYQDVPAGLVRGEAFIVRTTGESMYPRLRSGEPVVVEVNVPPVRFDDVLVEMSDGTGMVKEYRGQKDGVLFLWQYNPEGEVRVPQTQVRRLSAAWPWRRR